MPKVYHLSSSSSSSSSAENAEISKERERKSSRKSKKKHSRKHRREEEIHYSDDSLDEMRKRKKSKNRKRYRSRENKGNKRHSDSIQSDDLDRKYRRKTRDSEENQNREKTEELDPFVKYRSFLPKLHDLLSNHGDLSTELPYLLIKLCSGSSINLSQIPDLSVSTKLKELFKILRCTVVGREEFIFDDNGGWDLSSSGRDDEKSLVLVKLVRLLLDQSHLTMQNIASFEQKETEALKVHGEKTYEEAKVVPEANEASNENEIASLISMLLDTFQSKNKTEKSSSLAEELCSTMHMIHDGEIICLDGLEDECLRKAIEQFFTIMGLVKEEMDDSDDEDNHSDGGSMKNEEKNTSYGYTLPSLEVDVAGRVKEKLLVAMKATTNYHKKSIRQTVGPVLPKDVSSYKTAITQESDESDDEGPSPYDSQKAKVRPLKKKLTPTETQPQVENNGGREEWMMTPGEHNFLKGVISSGAMKSRKFKNEKSNNHPPPAPMNPDIKRQVDSIMNAHKEARGISLVEQHQIQKAEEKAAKDAAGPKGKNGESWNWSRKDLDAGRRVDKKYLNMVSFA